MKLLAMVLSLSALVACGGGGSSAPTSTVLTITGTAATGLAISGATITGKCKVGVGTTSSLYDGRYTLRIADGQLPCVLQITNPVDGIKHHTVAVGTGSTAAANITPLTQMTTARVLGTEPNVFFAAFDPAVATQKVTSANIQTAQTEIGQVLTGIVNTAELGDFMTTPLKAATQGSLDTGDAQDKLLDVLKVKLTSTQIGTLATALASNQTTDTIKQTVASMTTAPTPPIANAGVDQNVVKGTTVTLDASTSSAAVGKSLTYIWTLTFKPQGSSATLSAPTTVNPTFVADVAGLYVASVIVNDGTSGSSVAAVTVTSSVANAAPVANAGVPQSVVTTSLVTLDGRASSDANNDTLTYVWTLTDSPPGSKAVLSSTTSEKPTFTADLAGAYVASLVVNDAKLNSGATTTRVFATDAKMLNTPYTAPNGMTVTLIRFVMEDLASSSKTYTAVFTEENNTTSVIQQATLTLFLTNNVAARPIVVISGLTEMRHGDLTTTTFKFEVLDALKPLILQYDANHAFSSQPVTGALQWAFPTQ